MAVFVADEQDRAVDAEDLVRLARFVMVDRLVPEDMELSLLLVDRDTIAGLNEQHLGHAGPTDVLAFPIDAPGEAPPGSPAVLGDVVLCPSVAATQAGDHARTPHQELQLLTVHGILHLLGMDHADPDEKRDMFRLQDRILSDYRAEAAP